MCGVALPRVRESAARTPDLRDADGPPQPPRAPRPDLRTRRLWLRHDRPARRPALAGAGGHGDRRALAHDPPRRRGRRRIDRRRLRPAAAAAGCLVAGAGPGRRHPLGPRCAAGFGPGVPAARRGRRCPVPPHPGRRTAPGRSGGEGLARGAGRYRRVRPVGTRHLAGDRAGVRGGRQRAVGGGVRAGPVPGPAPQRAAPGRRLL